MTVLRSKIWKGIGRLEVPLHFERPGGETQAGELRNFLCLETIDRLSTSRGCPGEWPVSILTRQLAGQLIGFLDHGIDRRLALLLVKYLDYDKTDWND